MDTVKVTINGRELTVEKGRTVLQAAIENGIELHDVCSFGIFSILTMQTRQEPSMPMPGW